MTNTSRHLRINHIFLIVIIISTCSVGIAQKRRPPAVGRTAVIVDERLSALRESPQLSGRLVQRVRRGRLVAIRSQHRTREGVVFCRVSLTRRTSGWIQREAMVARSERGDDERLLRLIRASHDFDRIARARIFLDLYPRSPLRPTVLLILGDTAEAAAHTLARDASRRLNSEEMQDSLAPEFSYFLNYSGLDRYNRQGIHFVFDARTKKFRYSGAAWREILRRFPHSPEAEEAGKRLRRLPIDE